MGKMQVESTSKPVKAGMIVAFLIGAGSVAAGVHYGGQHGMMVGGIGLAVAASTWLLLRLAAWWQTG